MTLGQQLSENHGGEPEPLPGSLWHWLSEAGSSNPNNLALVVDNKGKPTVTWTYAQLIDRVEKLASYFTAQNVVAGDTIFTFIDNTEADVWTLLFWTAVRIGAIFAPENPHTLGRPQETRKLIETLRPAVVVVQDFDGSRRYEEYGHEPKVRLLCNELSKAGTSSSWLPMHSIQDLQAATNPAPHHTRSSESTALVMNTSGSTSLPKSCPITTRAFVIQTRQYHSFHRSNYTPRTRTLTLAFCYRPICYLGCLNTWQRGGTVIFAGSNIDEQRTVEVVRKWKVTHAWFVPAMVNLLSAYHDEKQSRGQGLESLEFVLMSGDASALSTVEKAKAFLPDSCKFAPHWGMSEGAPLFGFTEEEPLHLDKDSKIVGAGRALHGSRLRVCKSNTTTPVPRRTQGEFHVSSDATITQYLENRNPEDFYNDEYGRWFKTGDVALMDESGVIYIIGRTKDIIVYKGRNIVPAVIEGCIKEGFPGVEAVCIGLDDEVYGAVPAVVVQELRVGKEDVAKVVVERLGAWAALAGGVYSLKDLGMDAWPMNSSNKIDKKGLVSAVLKARE
ncbi:4-coumarate--CoA ligase 1 [Fulvia fulva]|uniref:4-coumarate--CoA ligase 1 n=1 Tax=Passalora fulva TaxID=5499 RepID=A0A9Q8PEF8_PASFU|nr:4-coumarate--CoA ligase 1 [Fulvia fulva]KAK4618815.1 4-coumarate--CoA ligase 1 [Fulvia fulva]UJO20912.1 4-coumarate--CoA ligase 1 [Fulvia fulva]